jgi:DNA-binding response OmpR family regulator
VARVVPISRPRATGIVPDRMPKALLVCDTSWVANDAHAALSVGQWEVETIDDPAQAATVAGDTRPDAVIIDMQVGSMGGMAVVRDIRDAFQGESRPRTILLLDRSADSFLAKRAGADAWVLKPFHASQLREAVSG